MKKVRREVSADLGSMVKRLREAKGYSVHKLGELSKTSAGYISRIERGVRKRPSIIVLQDLANGLGVNVNVLLSVTSDRDERNQVTLEQLLYSHDFSISNNDIVSTEVKDLILELVEIVYDIEWEKETILEDAIHILKVVYEIKEKIGK
ncbi:helix-turn-helix transcriptional regulator [Neobacillus niacini]|uniref:helix-turn-helix domain-containing protein n=1 Tax=Neobacillus niacini TaxID=86668 RepID=UPI002FFE8844